MKLKHLGTAAALLGSLAVAGVARAEMHHGGFGPGSGAEFLHGVNLTAEQKSQLKAIGKANWETLKPLMKQEHALHEQEINQLLAAGNVTAEQLQPILQQEESLRAQIDTARLNMLVQMRGILTADQVSAAATRHTQMEQLHEQEHALMGEPGEGPQ